MLPVANVSASVGDLLAHAVEHIESESARLDAEVLLAHVLKRPRHWAYTHPEAAVSPAQYQRYQTLVSRRAAGEPVAYLVGTREFWSLSLTVTQDTLIPRPETETLVEIALSHIDPTAPCRVWDLGTGSGAIALAIATERRKANILGTDVCPRAVAVAVGNASRLGLASSVTFKRADWHDSQPQGTFDVMVSNPPYVEMADHHLRSGDVRFEPRRALVGGPDGLDHLRQIIAVGARCLAPSGTLVVEHGATQADPVGDIFREHRYRDVRSHRDLSGQPRVTAARAPESLRNEVAS